MEFKGRRGVNRKENKNTLVQADIPEFKVIAVEFKGRRGVEQEHFRKQEFKQTSPSSMSLPWSLIADEKSNKNITENIRSSSRHPVQRHSRGVQGPARSQTQIQPETLHNRLCIAQEFRHRPQAKSVGKGRGGVKQNDRQERDTR